MGNVEFIYSLTKAPNKTYLKCSLTPNNKKCNCSVLQTKYLFCSVFFLE